jgi:hypothetical protein
VNPILFSVTFYVSTTSWPIQFGGSVVNLVLTEGANATRIPAGASLTIDLGSFQERGNFDLQGYIPPGVPPATSFPINLLTFGSTAAGVATADITYINRLGQF